MSLVSAPLDLEALLAPLDARQPVGSFDAEDETFQGIEHEMVKLGGLHEATMDWPYIEEASRRYLTQHCKHLRVAGHLMTARLQERSWRSWAEAAGVLAGMVERYWESSYPKPGVTGASGKRRLVALYIERLGDSLARLDANDAAKPHRDAAQLALDRLQACAGVAGLDVAMLTGLEARFRQRLEETRHRAADEPGKSSDQRDPEAISAAYFTSDRGFKPGDERENRRSLLAIADFINQQNACDATGYLLRRFALWAHLTSAPATRRDERTELMGVSLERVASYQEALAANNVSLALLQRLEKSVATSPYWIGGSFLAAGIAQRLEMPEVAAAIRTAAMRFVLRIPSLTKLQFMDGRPFVDQKTQAWLSGAEEGSPASNGREYASLRDELTTQLESHGVEGLLRRLEALQGGADGLRHRCHMMTIAADLLKARGFNWLTEGLYRSAHQQMSAASLDEWEPDLFNHLARQAQAGAPSA